MTKYLEKDSPKVVFKNQLKYFVEERKNALGYPTDLTPQRGSESDLNALLHLYSHPPDPVKERFPPAGAPTYQSVPQAYVAQSEAPLLRRHASYPTVWSPTGGFTYPPGSSDPLYIHSSSAARYNQYLTNPNYSAVTALHHYPYPSAVTDPTSAQHISSYASGQRPSSPYPRSVADIDPYATPSWRSDYF